MEMTSPLSIASPPRRLQDLAQSENMSPQGRVPRRQSTSSATQMPLSPTKQSTPPQLASSRFSKQFHDLIEHQREVHSEERALWFTERAELQERILQLEASIKRLQGFSSSQPPFSVEHQAGNHGFSSPQRGHGLRQTSGSSTGDEVWNPKPDIPPTRTFSETPNQIPKPPSRLPSIAEDLPTHRPSLESASRRQSLTHKPSISALQSDKNLDGITFKSSNLPRATDKNIMTPQSASPLSPSSSRQSPGRISLPPSVLTAPEDPYTKDAGHTPLARQAVPSTGGIGSSGTVTPTQPELERPPLDPHPTTVKLPSERSDSYFPSTEPDDPTADSSDPKLSEPLGLRNNKTQDTQFLNELDSKLQRAASSEAYGTPAVAWASDPNDGEVEDPFEQPEEEPKLRLKRSMNFGSAFGARMPGPGV